MYIMESHAIRLRNVLELCNKGGGVRCLGTQSALYLRKFTQREKSMYSDKAIYPQQLLLEEESMLGQVSLGEKDLGVWLWS